MNPFGFKITLFLVLGFLLLSGEAAYLYLHPGARLSLPEWGSDSGVPIVPPPSDPATREYRESIKALDQLRGVTTTAQTSKSPFNWENPFASSPVEPSSAEVPVGANQPATSPAAAPTLNLLDTLKSVTSASVTPGTSSKAPSGSDALDLLDSLKNTTTTVRPTAQ